MNDIYKILMILARPAAGKNEIIKYLNCLPDDERRSRFHIGKMYVLDDFPMIWTWFEEDDLLTQMGFPRLHTDENGYFRNKYLWDLLIERINLEYTKLKQNSDNSNNTIVIEFSRGKEHGGYKSAFSHLSDEIINKAAILYIYVSWKESLRKNKKRFNPEKPDSILEHSLPDEKLTKMYYETDWNELSETHNNFIKIGSSLVPYSIFENEDDVTSGNNSKLDSRLQTSLNRLWKNYSI
jgi:hypothetical protein